MPPSGAPAGAVVAAAAPEAPCGVWAGAAGAGSFGCPQARQPRAEPRPGASEADGAAERSERRHPRVAAPLAASSAAAGEAGAHDYGGREAAEHRC